MLVAFATLLVAPAWATTAVIGAGVALVVVRVVGGGWRRIRRVPRGSIVLGHGRGGRAVAVTEGDLSAHGLILGASGSGKTTTLMTILDQQIRRGRPVVAIDMKGSPAFAQQLVGAAAAAGRRFQLWTPDGPTYWNPLQHGNPTELKDKLVCTERFTEPHYQRAAERYLQTTLQVLAAARPGVAPTLEQVVALMDPDRLPVALREVPRPLARRVQDYRAGLTRDQVSAIRGLQTRLSIITESHTGRYLGPGGADAVDLPAALEGHAVVLFSLNSSRYGQFAAQLGTLVVQDLICATGHRLDRAARGAQLAQATVAIDEFSGIGGGHVVALFARGREAGVSGILATQEMADLDRAGPGVRDQVLGNTALKLILRQDVPESAQTAAQLAGTQKTWEETRQIGGTLFRGGAGLGSRREAERFVVHPNEVKSLGTGDAVLISKLGGERVRRIRVAPPGRPGPPHAPGLPRRDRGPRSGPEL
jgi:conjugal transfer pilus assembly protein TraD